MKALHQIDIMSVGVQPVGKKGPILEVAGRRYRWDESWAKLADTEARRAAFPHTALVVADSGNVLLFDSADRSIVTLSPDGHVVRMARTEIDEAHGVSLVVENDVPYLWLADASVGRRPDDDYGRRTDSSGSKVIKVSLDGRMVMTLEQPQHSAYVAGHYGPTCVAVNEERFGGNGDIWVADGYGESYVHRFDRRGKYLGSLSGEEGGGRFDGPHAVFVDRRRREPELYIADRANARIQVYGMDGNFRRSIQGFLHRPTWIARDGECLLVDEFTPPRVTVLDAADQLVGYLAESPVILERPGWPNVLDAERKPKRPDVKPGMLNSPHCVAVDADGSLYISEFLIGGRIIKLQKLAL